MDFNTDLFFMSPLMDLATFYMWLACPETHFIILPALIAKVATVRGISLEEETQDVMEGISGMGGYEVQLRIMYDASFYFSTGYLPCETEFFSDVVSDISVRKDMTVNPCVPLVISDIVVPEDSRTTNVSGVNLEVENLLAIFTGFTAQLSYHIGTNLFKKWVREVKRSAQAKTNDMSRFVLVSRDLLAHFAQRMWKQDTSLARLSDVDTSDEVEMALRVRFLAWLYFKEDVLADSDDYPFPDFVGFTDELRSTGKITGEQRRMLDNSIIPKPTLEKILGAVPFDNFKLPRSLVSVKSEKDASSCSHFLCPSYSTNAGAKEIEMGDAPSCVDDDDIVVPTAITTISAGL